MSVLREQLALEYRMVTEFAPLLQDFREETLPRGTMELKDKSKTAFVAAASEMRLKVYKDHKVSAIVYAENHG